MERCDRVNGALRSTGASKVVVFFSTTSSSSSPNDDEESIFKAAKKLREKGVQVFVVAIGKMYSESEVHAIASEPHHEHLGFLEKVTDLEPFTHSMVRKMCQGGFTFEHLLLH